jgi:hypothetical protein
VIIDWGVVARAIHVVGVVAWIGGVWLVTTVLLLGMKKKPTQKWICEEPGSALWRTAVHLAFVLGWCVAPARGPTAINVLVTFAAVMRDR